jgi:hypothetical protein
LSSGSGSPDACSAAPMSLSVAVPLERHDIRGEA